MLKGRLLITLLLLGIMTACGAAVAHAAVVDQNETVLKVLDPRSQFWGPLAQKISPRLDDLAGKKIAVINNGKAGGDHMIEPMSKVLKEKFPTATIQQYKVSFFDYAKKEEDMKKIADWAEAVVELLGD